MLTTNQAAALANVARVTILKWIARGDLPAEKIGRDWMIDETELQRVAPRLLERRKGGRSTWKQTAQPDKTKETRK